MAQTVRIVRPQRTGMTEKTRAAAFLEIIRPLGYYTEVEENYDWSVHIQQNAGSPKYAVVWVDEEDEPIYTINGRPYYCQVFFHFIWHDKQQGPEKLNSDMILAITAAYMNKYPDALFNFEECSDDNMFLDRHDIDTVTARPFVPDWFRSFRGHLRSKPVNGSRTDCTLM